MTATDLPEAAARRLASSAWSSGLSVTDFAACQHMGLRPVGLVQGFCVMGWNPSLYYPAAGGYWSANYRWANSLSTYPCPHGVVYSNEHPYAGFNIEGVGLEQVWADGYDTTLHRMLEEAEALGAHGVIGVMDATKSLIGPNVREFHLLGTAVVVEGSPHPKKIWSTYLAGVRLSKLLEAGMQPESIVGAFAAVTVFPSCVTEIQEGGGYDPYGRVVAAGEISQLSDAETAVRRLVRDHIKSTLGDGSLHGADLQVHEGGGGGHTMFSAILRGTRVRKVRDVEPLPAPIPTVRLS